MNIKMPPQRRIISKATLKVVSFPTVVMSIIVSNAAYRSSICEGFIPSSVDRVSRSRLSTIKSSSRTLDKSAFRVSCPIMNLSVDDDSNEAQIQHFLNSNIHESNSETEPLAKNSEQRKVAPTRNDELRQDVSALVLPLVVGALTGVGVSLFKLSIDEVRQFTYGMDFVQWHDTAFQAAFIPAAGGLAVSLLGSLGEFSPGLRGQVAEVDAGSEAKSPFRYLRKTLAAIVSAFKYDYCCFALHAILLLSL